MDEIVTNASQEGKTYRSLSKYGSLVKSRTFRELTMNSNTSTKKSNYQYRCTNIYTEKPEWLTEQNKGLINFGVIMCPREDCNEKVGSYNSQGTKCTSCNV
jgi:hypothetical protein